MKLLEDGSRYTVLEELRTFTVLGIRFWDTVYDAQIRDGLTVRAWPEQATLPVVTATRTLSDVYAFHRLPGLGGYERPLPGRPRSPSSPEVAPFVVEIVDERRRFVPLAVRVWLPLAESGLFLTQPPGSPPVAAPGFYLFSAPTRGRASNIAIVRGALIDDISEAPATWALIETRVEGEEPNYSIADANGEFAVQFPLPTVTGGLGPLDASPPSPIGPLIQDRTWNLEVNVHYEPGRLEPLPGTDLPDIREIFRQSPAGLRLDLESPPAPLSESWTGTIGFDGEVVLRNGEDPVLRVVAEDSSP